MTERISLLKRYSNACYGARTVVDPVCRLSIKRNTTAATRERDGRTYHFCSEACALAFLQDRRKEELSLPPAEASAACTTGVASPTDREA